MTVIPSRAREGLGVVGWLDADGNEADLTLTLEVPALAPRPTLDRIDAWRARRATVDLLGSYLIGRVATPVDPDPRP